MFSQTFMESFLTRSSRASNIDVTIVSLPLLLLRVLVFFTAQLVDIFYVWTFVNILDVLFIHTPNKPSAPASIFPNLRIVNHHKHHRTPNSSSQTTPATCPSIFSVPATQSPSSRKTEVAAPIKNLVDTSSRISTDTALPPKPSIIQHSVKHNMSLLASVPPEILLKIASNLSRPNLHTLSIVSRGFYHFLGPQNLTKDETYTLRKSIANRSFGYQQVCKTCVELRSFFHFPTTKKGTNDDECLDCLRRRRLFKSDVQRWLGLRIEKCRGCVRWIIESKPHTCLITPARPEDRVTTAPIGFQSVDAVRQFFDLMEKSLPERWLHRRLMSPGRAQLKSEAAERRLRDVVDRLHNLRLERVKTRWAKKQQMMLASAGLDTQMMGMGETETPAGMVTREAMKQERVKSN